MMDRKELLRHLEFEYCGYLEACQWEQEVNGVTVEPIDFEDYCNQRGVELPKDEN